MSDGTKTFKVYVGETPIYKDSGGVVFYEKELRPLAQSRVIKVATTTSRDIFTGQMDSTQAVEVDLSKSGKLIFDVHEQDIEGQFKKGPFAIGMTSEGAMVQRGVRG